MEITNQIKNIDTIQAGNSMYALAERLYPICRSITGNGVRETLQIIKSYIPLDIIEVPTGTKVFDWEIPEEWNIRDAWIKDDKGEKIIDFKKLNLHVLNYSTPVEETIPLEELKKHIFTLPGQPDLVPYRTSYHNRQWGFCMSHNQLVGLENKNYKVKIDSDIKPGSLTYGEFYIQGETKAEILVSCHVCHPSLCNDNLSGIAVAVHLAAFLTTIKPHFSYRFIFIPGTIGSITWLSRNENILKNIRYGLVLNLLGDSSPFHYKKSRRENTATDTILAYVLADKEGSEIRNWSPYGYDERQFCSPGFDLPVGRLSRKPHGEFPEYHTSADNLDFISGSNMAQSYLLLLDVFTVMEGNRKLINLNPKGEPQLGKRGLYKNVGGQSNQQDYQMAILWVLSLSDGNHTMLDIAKKAGLPFNLLVNAAHDLEKADLLKEIN